MNKSMVYSTTHELQIKCPHQLLMLICDGQGTPRTLQPLVDYTIHLLIYKQCKPHCCCLKSGYSKLSYRSRQPSLSPKKLLKIKMPSARDILEH